MTVEEFIGKLRLYNPQLRITVRVFDEEFAESLIDIDRIRLGGYESPPKGNLSFERGLDNHGCPVIIIDTPIPKTGL